MPKRIHWSQMICTQQELSKILTANNFQPGKFMVTSIGNEQMLVLFVNKELPNVE